MRQAVATLFLRLRVFFLAAHRQAKMGCVKRCQFDSGIISGHLPANVFPETQQGSGFSPECRQQGARFPGTSPWRPFRLRSRSASSLTVDIVAGKIGREETTARWRELAGESCESAGCKATALINPWQTSHETSQKFGAIIQGSRGRRFTARPASILARWQRPAPGRPLRGFRRASVSTHRPAASSLRR